VEEEAWPFSISWAFAPPFWRRLKLSASITYRERSRKKKKTKKIDHELRDGSPFQVNVGWVWLGKEGYGRVRREHAVFGSCGGKNLPSSSPAPTLNGAPPPMGTTIPLHTLIDPFFVSGDQLTEILLSGGEVAALSLSARHVEGRERKRWLEQS